MRPPCSALYRPVRLFVWVRRGKQEDVALPMVRALSMIMRHLGVQDVAESVLATQHEP